LLEGLVSKGVAKGMKAGIAKGMEAGMAKGLAEGVAKGELSMKRKLGGLALVGGVALCYTAYKGCNIAYSKFIKPKFDNKRLDEQDVIVESEEIIDTKKIMDDYMLSNLEEASVDTETRILLIEETSVEEHRSFKIIVEDDYYYILSTSDLGVKIECHRGEEITDVLSDLQYSGERNQSPSQLVYEHLLINGYLNKSFEDPEYIDMSLSAEE